LKIKGFFLGLFFYPYSYPYSEERSPGPGVMNGTIIPFALAGVSDPSGCR